MCVCGDIITFLEELVDGNVQRRNEAEQTVKARMQNGLTW